MANLTQERLKEVLHYDPYTGVFTRRTTIRSNLKAGDIAGGIHHKGYRIIRVDDGRYSAHRLAGLYMTGTWPKKQFDHINHDKDDNRWCNIREVSNEENCKNRGLRKNNKSGVLGVCWSKQHCKWRASIYVNSEQKYLGGFERKQDAIIARLTANKQYGYHPNHGN